MAALGLFALNLMAVISYPAMPEIARQFHVYWGMLLAPAAGLWRRRLVGGSLLLRRLHP